MENQIKNRVFISWSGPRSRHVAESLRDWLRLVLQNLDPWMSDRDIGAGADWRKDIRESLESAVAGIVCLTPENLESRWLLFEAGALARGIGDPVCTYLYDLKPTDVSPPLSTFQHSMSNEGDTKKLVARLNQLLGQTGLSSTDLNKSLGKWWPDLEKDLERVPRTDSPPPPKREEMELQAETLDIVRDLRRQLSRVEREVRGNRVRFARQGVAGAVAGILGRYSNAPITVYPDAAITVGASAAKPAEGETIVFSDNVPGGTGQGLTITGAASEDKQGPRY